MADQTQSQAQTPDPLREAIEQAQAGHKVQARAMLRTYVAAHPDSQIAWLWLATVAEHETERKEALQNVVRLDPSNEHALAALTQLGHTIPMLLAYPEKRVLGRLGWIELGVIAAFVAVIVVAAVIIIHEVSSGAATPVPTRTPSPTVTLTPSITLTPLPTHTPGPSPTPYVQPTLAPTWTPAPSLTPPPTRTLAPTITMLPTRTSPPSATLRPSATPSNTVRPTETTAVE